MGYDSHVIEYISERGECWDCNLCNKELADYQYFLCHRLLLFFQHIFYILGKHERPSVKMCGVIPGFNSSCIPTLSIEVLQRMILLRRESEEPVTRWAGWDMCLIDTINREATVSLTMHGSAALLVFIEEGAAMLIDHDTVFMQCLEAVALELLGEDSGLLA